MTLIKTTFAEKFGQVLSLTQNWLPFLVHRWERFPFEFAFLYEADRLKMLLCL